MRKAFVMSLVFVLVTATGWAAAEKNRKVIATWNKVPVFGVPTPNALRIELTDANDDPAAGKVHLQSIDPTLLLFPSDDPADRRQDITVDIGRAGEALVGVARAKDEPVYIDAYAVEDEDVVSDIVRIRDPFDSRARTSITGYTGVVFDTFASSDVTKVFDSNNNNDVKERGIFGLDFEHRLMKRHDHQLWIYGETVHGTRSAEVKCPAPSNQTASTPDVCKDTQNQTPPTTDFTTLLRAATSVEAFVGLRYEPPFRTFTENSCAFYVKTEYGFMKVAGSGDGIIKEDHVGVGVMLTDGKFRESYLELGHGRTDLFQSHPGNRWKIDGYLVLDPGIPSGNESFAAPFVQMTVDWHGGHGTGADAVQIYTGVNLALDKLKIGVTKSGGQ